MGTTGDKPRKPRRRMARVSKYPDASGNPLAGLTGDGDGECRDRAPVADHPSTITRWQDRFRVPLATRTSTNTNATSNGIRSGTRTCS